MAANVQPLSRALDARRTVAVFDLDGTLTSRDTLLAFLRFLVGTRGFLARLPLVAMIVAAMVLRLVPRSRAKELVLALFMRGRSRAELELRGETFARERLPAMLRTQAEARLRWHQKSGHLCVLLTASPAIYAAAFARVIGFDAVPATELEDDERDRAAGRRARVNCPGRG